MSGFDSTFRNIVGRAATDKERVRLYQLKEVLGEVGESPSIWAMMILQHVHEEHLRQITHDLQITAMGSTPVMERIRVWRQALIFSSLFMAFCTFFVGYSLWHTAESFEKLITERVAAEQLRREAGPLIAARHESVSAITGMVTSSLEFAEAFARTTSSERRRWATMIHLWNMPFYVERRTMEGLPWPCVSVPTEDPTGRGLQLGTWGESSAAPPVMGCVVPLPR